MADKFIQITINTKANLEYKKTFNQWQSTSKNTKYSLKLPNTAENQRFVSLLGRLISQEEFLIEAYFETSDE